MPDHTQIFEIFLNINVKQFFNQYIEDESPNSFTKFLEKRGESKITEMKWTEPNEENISYNGTKVKLIKQITAEFNVKNTSTMYKMIPTTKYFKLIEQTDTVLRILILNKFSETQYSDTHGVEEEWLLQSLPNGKCCVFRATSGVIWYKQTMMKNAIKIDCEKRFVELQAAYKSWI